MTFLELGFLKAAPKDLRILVANSPDIEIPFDKVLDYITPCGPITRSTPIEMDDPELASCLARGPIIYVNLGTHHFFDLALVTEFAGAIKSLLDAETTSKAISADHGLIQILWKMPRKLSEDENRSEFWGPWIGFREIMSPYIERDRVWIKYWFIAEPKSILEPGHMICSVNHGGSNSFHEAIWF
ncbi:glycosyltransferase sdnJ [Colletotrichum liriopes]|uniref:Glycosyltransferase sdnJ n=1 Tax=Colletotrichum liriopes TaxID=708192 RepID=A0AA37GG49_9PEZI|nr:glycosyltransferase sdnJ [Colletotrichum liriopes]